MYLHLKPPGSGSIRTQGRSGRVLVRAEGDEQNLVCGGDVHLPGQNLPGSGDVRRLVVGGGITADRQDSELSTDSISTTVGKREVNTW